MAWISDIPGGVLKNHALSRDIRREAIADTQFFRFLRAESGFGKNRGESVTVTRILTLPNATRIGETDRLPSGRPAIESKQVSPAQWGFKIPVTEFETQLNTFNIMNEFQRRLRDQIALTMDQMSAEAFKKTPLKYTPLATGVGEINTGGAPTSVSDRNLAVQDLRNIWDELRSRKVPAFRNGRYVGILSTKAARGIKNDPEYKDWLAPTTSDPLITGRLRDVEGFALFETNHLAALKDLVGTSTTTGEALFFGDDAAGLVRVADPELRAAPVEDDLGRQREVGWVGVLDSFLVWEKASLARAIHVDSL